MLTMKYRSLQNVPTLPGIPWVEESNYDAGSGLRDLMRLSGEEMKNQPLVHFVNDSAIIPTSLHIGRAAASAAGAFGSMISVIANAQSQTSAIAQKPEKKSTQDPNKSIKENLPKALTVDIKHSELTTTAINAAKVDGKGVLWGMFSPTALKENAKMGILKGLPFLHMSQSVDGRWFHTHGNFDCAPIKNELACKPFGPSIERAIRKRNAIDLEDSLAQCRAIGSIVRTPEEWSCHPQGKFLLNTPPVEIEKIADGPLPDTLWSGLNDRSIKTQDLQRLPLSGLRVLDLTRVLAGPTSARLLSEYGAECLKITSPHLPYYVFFSKVENVGKRSASLDLRASAQQELLKKLVKTSDVFISSYRHNALEKFGFGPKQVAELCPQGVIYVSLSCYGSGPWLGRAGYDSLAQAATGLSAAHSGVAKNRKPEFVPMAAPNDYITGYLAAFGVLCALRRRQKEGGSYHVKVSLAQAAMWILKFGYRVKPARRDTKFKQLKPGYFDRDTLRQAQRYLQTEPSAFGPIQLMSTPLDFSGSSIRGYYKYPSVPFGTHEPLWL